MTDVAKAVEAMKAKFNPAAAAGLDLVFGFNITDEKKYFTLTVANGTCELHEAQAPAPGDENVAGAQVTLIMNAETMEGIVSGETDGMQAFMSGKLRTAGDMMLAMKLSDLFPS
ncbi:Putative sterol carrier protein [Pseudomonas extremaustralis]|uniref:SCP2 sterol-binding domain-containing protein n=1 Tax=Pseudomonas extremaustralis TaxID=359110 RepID=UPI00099C0D0B|nr:SCP2 sterol-binding domain-containing protein [Pseudomonas extremaustralis]SKA90683.1 Putative sterol carrier protein [Pseudomonas extremaustralis]